MFSVDLPVKAYVKQYITLNYGNPADFSSDKYINSQFRRCLTKPCTRYNIRYKELSELFYSSSIKVKISQDDFYRHGWELTPTDTVAFGKIMEHQAKFFMRNMISFYLTYLIKRDAILKFQQTFGFTEDIWSYDSIKKDFYRKVDFENSNYSKELSTKIEKIILVNLSNLGTLSHKAISHYDNLKKAD